MLLLLAALLATSSYASAPTFHFSTDNDITGNDFGYSGGFLLELGESPEEGWTQNARFSSALYSQRVLPYGDASNPSYAVFTDWAHAPVDRILEPKNTQSERFEQNSFLSYQIGYRAPKSWFSWLIEGGVTQTESNSGYIPLALGFQKFLHRLIGATKYNIVSDGKSTRYGAFIKPTFIAQTDLIGKERFSLNGKVQSGASVDTEGRRQVFFTSLGLKARIGGLEFGSTGGTQLAGRHKQIVIRHAIAYAFSTWTLEGSRTQLLTHTGYSDLFVTDYVDQDPIYLLRIKVPF